MPRRDLLFKQSILNFRNLFLFVWITCLYLYTYKAHFQRIYISKTAATQAFVYVEKTRPLRAAQRT